MLINAQTLVNSIRQLPSPSPAINRLLDLLQDPDGCNDEIIDVVKQDAVLTARVLAKCNTASEAAAEPVASIHQAVFLLGYRRIFRLVMSLSFGSTLQRSLPGYDLEQGALWRHSLLTGLISESLTGATTLSVLPSIAYTAGLLHDIGKTVLDHVLDQGTRAAIRAQLQQKGNSYLKAERAVLKTDHCEVGACLLRRWRFPEIINEAVENHHEPVTTPAARLSALVYVSDVLGQDMGPVLDLNDSFTVAEEEPARALGLSMDEVERGLIGAYDRLQEIEPLAAV